MQLRTHDGIICYKKIKTKTVSYKISTEILIAFETSSEFFNLSNICSFKKGGFAYLVFQIWQHIVQQSHFLLLYSRCSVWQFLSLNCNLTGKEIANIHEPPHDKTNKMTVCPAKTQISLGIRPVWLGSSLSALRSAWASAQSNQSLRCPHEEGLGP